MFCLWGIERAERKTLELLLEEDRKMTETLEMLVEEKEREILALKSGENE